MNWTHHSVLLALGFLGFLAAAALVLFIVNLAARRRSNPMTTQTGGIVPYLSLGGVLGFLSGCGLLILQYRAIGFALAGGGALAACGSILLNAARAKSKRAFWPVVSARCTDQKLRKMSFSNGDGAWDGWRWSLVCEISYARKNYRVTPMVRWSDAEQQESPFRSEEKARRFIALAITSSGECKLRVNPSNPLEAELLS